MSSSPTPETAVKAKKRSPEPIGLRVVQMADPDTGALRRVLTAATASDADRLRTKGNKVGDLVFARMTKPRNPGFHRLAHAIGKLAVENIDAFVHMEPHQALKRLQIESGAGCDLMQVQLQSVWSQVLGFIEVNIGRPVADMLRLAMEAMGLKGQLITVAVPRSLSYDSMDEIEFKAVVKTICKHMSITYWPTLSPMQIEDMAEAMKDLTQ